MKRIFLFISIILIISGCNEQSNSHDSKYTKRITSVKVFNSDDSQFAEVIFSYDNKNRLKTIDCLYSDDDSEVSYWVNTFSYSSSSIISDFNTSHSYTPYMQDTEITTTLNFRDTMILKDGLCIKENMMITVSGKGVMDNPQLYHYPFHHYYYSFLKDPITTIQENNGIKTITISDNGNAENLYSANRELIAKIGSHTGTDSFFWSNGKLVEIKGFGNDVITLDYSPIINPFINTSLEIMFPLLILGTGYFPYVPATIALPKVFGLNPQQLLKSIEIDHHSYIDYYEFQYAYNSEDYISSILVYYTGPYSSHSYLRSRYEIEYD